MKKTRRKRPVRPKTDDILPEYDFSRARRNPYAARLAGAHIVVVDPDLAKEFPTSAAVNAALRALASLLRRQPPVPRPKTRVRGRRRVR